MLVTLPCILLLLDFWPLRRFQFPLKKQPKPVFYRLLIEKIPFFLLAAACCWVTFHVQNTTGAVKMATLLSITDRFEHVPIAYFWYILKLFWPSHLSVYYILRTTISDQDAFLSCLLLCALTAGALFWIRKFPYFIVGWLWFLGTLVPVIGFVQVGNQSYADRYTYIPYIGLFICLAWGLPELLAKWPRPRRQVVLAAGAALVAATCYWRTVVETHYWKDGFTLLNRAIALDPNDEYPWLLLGLEYEVHGNNDKAIECATHATVVNDNFNLAWHVLGHTLELKGDYPGAIDAYQRAALCTYYVGDKVDTLDDLGDLFMRTGQYDQAVASYQNSLALSPNQPLVKKRLAQCLASANQPAQAIAGYQDYLNLQPDDREAQLNLAMLLGGAGRDAEAIPHYRKVIELDTNVLLALNNLAWLLATDPDHKLRNGKAAVALAEHACQRTHYQEAFLIGTLAAAYAEAGRFDDAVAAAQKAHDVALAHGQKDIAEKNLHLMQLYKSGQPFHMDAPTPPSQKPPP
jgi:tetratricopeptide (TPR) repeat protein